MPVLESWVTVDRTGLRGGSGWQADTAVLGNAYEKKRWGTSLAPYGSLAFGSASHPTGGPF